MLVSKFVKIGVCLRNHVHNLAVTGARSRKTSCCQISVLPTSATDYYHFDYILVLKGVVKVLLG